MVLFKQYLDTSVENEKIKIYISFNKDRINWATNESKKIGYQVTAVPVKVSNTVGARIEESGAFTGFNDCILEIDRQSKKRLDKAIELLQAKIPTYKEWFKNKGYNFNE